MKRKARSSIDCRLLELMMICEIEFVDWVTKPGKGENESSFWRV